MTAIADLPDIRPSLLLDFANSGRVDPRIECTRASSATCFGPDGKLRTVPANVPRIDYDPVTGKCLGLLVEDPRTNTGTPLIASGSVPQAPTYTYNADLPSLVAGRVPVRNYAVGAVDASSSAGDRANIRANPAGLTENTTYTASIYVCGVKDGATRATMYFNMPGITALLATVDLVVGAWRRLVLTFTLPAGVSGTGALRVAGSGGADPLQPFGADGYQFEVGAFASSYIPTETSAVTRAGDQVFLEGLAFTGAIGSGLGAVLCTYTGKSATGNQIVLQARSASTTLGFAFQFTAAGAARNRALLEDGSGSPPNFSTRPIEVGARYRAGLSWASDKAHNTVNGGFVSSVTQPINIGAPQRLGLGHNGFGGSIFNGHIHDVSLYAGYLQPAQLQRLTA